jgi:dsDNA-specific endonuclease/ATPase MutS2
MAAKSQRQMPTLDLHGRTVGEVFDLVDRFITQNHHRPQVKIMPGKGSGKVKAEVVRYLKLGGYPWSHEVLPTGQTNTGCLVIHLA